MTDNKSFTIDENDYKYLGEYNVDSSSMYIGDASSVTSVPTVLEGQGGYMADPKSKRIYGIGFNSLGEGTGKIYLGKNGSLVVSNSLGLLPWEEEESSTKQLSKSVGSIPISMELPKLNLISEKYTINSPEVLWIGDAEYFSPNEEEENKVALDTQLTDFRNSNTIFSSLIYPMGNTGLGFIVRYPDSGHITIKRFQDEQGVYDFFILTWSK